MTVRLSLDAVTLCCIDTRHTAQAWYAIDRCMAHVDFGEVLFFCSETAAQTAQGRPGVRHVVIPALRSIQDYSRFVLRDLAPHIQSTHVLIIQWDGFITHPHLWDPEFIAWDYIGAPWVYKNRPSEVGNGGFSLRSKKLLQATHALPWDEKEPEDAAVCRTMRPTLESRFGLKIAPVDVAERFSHEYGPHQECFGFHGMHDFAHRMSPTELDSWLQTAPADLLKHWHARNLVKNLIKAGRRGEAKRLIQRRVALSGWKGDDLLLWLRSCFQ